MRTLAGIGFRNPDTGVPHGEWTSSVKSVKAPEVILADVTFNEDTSHFPQAGTVTSSPQGQTLLVGPLPDSYARMRGIPEGEKIYRLGFPPSMVHSKVPEHPTTEELQARLDQASHIYLAKAEDGQTKKEIPAGLRGKGGKGKMKKGKGSLKTAGRAESEESASDREQVEVEEEQE